MKTVAEKLSDKLNNDPVVTHWGQLKMRGSVALADDIVGQAAIIAESAYEPVYCDCCGEDCKKYRNEVGFVELVSVYKDGVLSRTYHFRLCARCLFEAECEDREAGENPSPPYISYAFKIKNPSDTEYRNGGYFPPS